MKIACPRCEQDWIQKAKVRRTGKSFCICPECEAVWFSENEIGYETFNYFNLFMERLGLEADWSEVDLIGNVEKI